MQMVKYVCILQTLVDAKSPEGKLER